MRLKDSFHTYAAITIVFWSLAYVLTRLTLEYFSPFSLGFLRYFAASCALMILALSTRMKPPRKTDVKWFLISGFFGFFLYMIAFNQGCKTVTASTSSVIIATVPVMTALLARWVCHEKLNILQWLAIAVEFLGVAVLLLLNHVFSFNRGLLWLLLAAAALSIYNLLQRKLTRTYSALQASAFSIFMGTLMLAVFLPESVREVRSAPPVQLFYIAVLGIFSSAIAYAAWAKAFAKAKQASSVSNYMFLTPFLTTLLGFLLAHERPDLPTYAGGGLILLGVLIFNFGGRLRARILRTDKHADDPHAGARQ